MACAVPPMVNALNRPFWDAAAQDFFVLPWCIDTRRAFWPPSPISPFTGGCVDWRAAERGGEIVGLVIYRRAFQAAFADHIPFGIALVALDAGPRLQVHVEMSDAAAAAVSDAAAPLRTGDRVTIRFRPILAGGPMLPVAIPLST